MPTAAKRTENMAKHMTDAEKAARQDAEDAVLPERTDGPQLKKPRLMAKDKAAGRYWNLVLKRMAGLQILDNLDSDALGVYCTMLSRYERLKALSAELARKIDVLDEKADDVRILLKLTESLNSLEGKSQALERNILQYAEKLGLTPSGRARLAAKRAENAGEEDPDADLFG